MKQLQKCSCVLLASTILYVCVSPAHARTWVIKANGTGDAATIQAGIDSSVTGDIVSLEPGVYTGAGNRDMSLGGKGITVTSSSGAAATIIDCQGLGRAFILDGGETSSSVLSHLTFENGVSPTPGSWAGAVYCQGSSPVITHCVFRNNSAGTGGAVGCANSSAQVLFNEFSNNSATQGGAIASGFGGSVGAHIEGNTFINNSATSFGGAVYSFEAANTVTGNLLVDNSAGTAGGGIYHKYAHVMIESNVFYLCSAGSQGGGVYVSAYFATVVGNTLSENDAPSGGGVYCGANFPEASFPTVDHNILAFSTQGEGIACDPSASPTVSCNDLFGNADGDAICGTDGGNNIFLDPQFCGIAMTGNVALRVDSPCTAANNPTCGLIGASPVVCGPLSTRVMSWGEVKAIYR